MEREERHPVVQAIVDKIKSEGIFDALRKDCLSDVDTKPAYQNLKQKVENACSKFLSRIVWSSSLNKVQLREQMRKNLEESGVLSSGVRRLVNQVITPKTDKEIKPKVAQVVCEYLNLNPDDLLEDSSQDEYQVDEPQAPVSLYPFNPYAPPPPFSAPPPLPGFEDTNNPPLPAPPLPPESGDSTIKSAADAESAYKEQNEDMEISDRSDSEETSKPPSPSADIMAAKREVDMDCTMTSDEEAGEAADATDLTKGLAAYMAGDDPKQITTSQLEDDNMSISSNEQSGSNTPVAASEEKKETEDAPSNVQTETLTVDKKKTKRKDPVLAESQQMAAPVVERREMRRQRTRNKKYLSDEFTSIFTEKRELLSEAYSQDYVEEEIVTTDDMTTVVAMDNMGTEDKLQAVVEADKAVCLSAAAVSENQSRPGSAASSKSSNSGGTEKLKQGRHSKYHLEEPTRTRMSLRRKTKEQDTAPQVKPEAKPLTRSQQRKSTAAEPERPQMEKRVLRSGRSVELPTPPVSHLVQPESRSSTPTQDEHDDQAPSEDACEGLVVLDSWSPSTGQNEEEINPETPVEDEIESVSTTSVTADVQSEPVQLISRGESLPQAGGSVEPSEPPAEPSQLSYEPTKLPERPPSPPVATIIPSEPPSIQPAPLPVLPETAPAPPPPEDPASLKIPTPPPSHSTEDITAGQSELAQCGEADMELDDGAGTPLMDETAEETRSQKHAQAAESSYEKAAPSENLSDNIVEEPGLSEAGDKTTEEVGDLEDGEEDGEEEDLQELERLAQRKLEILKAIELPDSILNERRAAVKDPSSEEEEGEITDSSSEEEKRKKKKSKKSKKKKSKKDSKRRRYDNSPGPSKRSRYY